MLAVAVFAATYIGMAAGRVPGVGLDRSGIALIGAVVLVAADSVPADEVGDAIHFPTLLLLGGLMVISARMEGLGLYAAAGNWIAARAHRPAALLAAVVAGGGLLSAVLVNDVVVLALTPLLCRALADAGRDPRPFALALAMASNAGSAASLIGNPQNIMIGQVGRLGFWEYTGFAALPALVALAATFVVVRLFWARELRSAGDAPHAGREETARRVERSDLWLAAGALGALLALFAMGMDRALAAISVAAVLLASRSSRSRDLLGRIDVPLLVLFAGLFVVNEAFMRTGVPEAWLWWLREQELSPTSLAVLAPLAIAASNTIGNVPAVILILNLWPDLPPGTLQGLALLSTLAGNLLLTGSLANLIVAERAMDAGVRLTFRDFAVVGLPITAVSTVAASAWVLATGAMAV